jgi:hypothetical protein
MPPPTGQKQHGGATEQRHKFAARVPDPSVRWGREWVIPYNVLITADSDAPIVVVTTWPEARPTADVLVEKADTLAAVENVPALSLRARRVVDGAGERPIFRFSLRNHIWEPYDKLDYHFNATIDRVSKRTGRPIKVKRWHVHALDIGDTRPAIMGFRNQEGANHEAAFAGAANDVEKCHRFDAHAASKSDFGSWMRNTYSFNYTGHGAVMCGTCGRQYSVITASGPDFGRWTTCPGDATHCDPHSSHCIGAAPYFQAADASSTATVPRAPRYLMFSVCCGGAFESSLGDAYISRGTKYCIMFQRATRCDWARDYTKAFFDAWVGAHSCDPDKVPDIFDSLQATWDARLSPVLFGRPAPPPSPTPAPSGVRGALRALAARVRMMF